MDNEKRVQLEKEADLKWELEKVDWGKGLWTGEPNLVRWVDGVTGLPCLVMRGPGGQMNGYVGVRAGHPWYGRHYWKPVCDPPCEVVGLGDLWDCEHRPGRVVEVHFGLTYSGRNDEAVCVDTENEAVWVFGFDTAHCDDIAPKYDKTVRKLRGPGSSADIPGRTYRTVEWVKGETERLAAQLHEQLHGTQMVLPGFEGVV